MDYWTRTGNIGKTMANQSQGYIRLFDVIVPRNGPKINASFDALEAIDKFLPGLGMVRTDMSLTAKSGTTLSHPFGGGF